MSNSATVFHYTTVCSSFKLTDHTDMSILAAVEKAQLLPFLSLEFSSAV